MKKSIPLLFLVFCLLIAGCGGESSQAQSAENTEAHNAQNQYLISFFNFQETEDFYFGTSLNGNYIHYYDKTTGISGMLCADPSCLHKSADCSAYVGTSSSLTYYGDCLYWVSTDSTGGREYYLWRSDLTGSNREKVKHLSFEDVIITYQPQKYIVHQEALYLLGQASIVTGTEVSVRLTLLSTPLDSSEEITPLYDQTFDKNVWSTVRFVGENVYFSVMSSSDGILSDITIYCYNTEDGTSEIVYEETGMTESPGDIWVTEQGEIYLPGIGESGTYLWKLESGQRTELAAWEGDVYNMSIPNIMDGIAIQTSKEDGVRSIQVVTLAGESIYSGLLFPENVSGLPGDPNEYFIAIVGGDENKLILDLPNSTNLGQEYILALDLQDNLKATVLWISQG